jgi:hypothetical protein
MTERRCGTCRWHGIEGFDRYHGENAEGLGDMGFCLRFPPMPEFIRHWHMWQKAEQSHDIPDEIVFAVWPETSVEDWCGEWQTQEPPTP